jgi:hypothetical protein
LARHKLNALILRINIEDLIVTIEAWRQERLRWENWEALGPEAEEMAKGEIRRRRWRGAAGGLLPGGHDAQSVASEAIRQMLSGETRLKPGWTGERMRVELRRLVRSLVRRLHRLTEAARTTSEWEGGKSIFSRIKGGGRDAFEEAVGAEERQEREMLLREFWGSLSDAPELSELLGKLCEEKASTEELASRTGMTMADVRRARRRLARRIESFAKRKGLGGVETGGTHASALVDNGGTHGKARRREGNRNRR